VEMANAYKNFVKKPEKKKGLENFELDGRKMLQYVHVI
jgi:predicted RNA-binding protein